MAIADLVYPADIAKRPEGGASGNGQSGNNSSDNCNCGCNSEVWFVPPPKPYDYPPYPPFPPYVPPIEPIPMKKSSIEAQICKLSRKSATIKKMIENFEEKNKDAIIKIGGTSYNFGAYKVFSKDEQGLPVEEDSVYGERILSILTDELAAIKAKIQELASELDDEEFLTSDTDKTVTQG